MNNIILIERFIGINKLSKDFNSLFLIKFLIFFNMILESPILTIFINKIKKLIAFDDLFEFNDIGVILEIS